MVFGNPVPGRIQAKTERWDRTSFIVTTTFAGHRARKPPQSGVDIGNAREGGDVYAAERGTVAETLIDKGNGALIVRVDHGKLIDGKRTITGYAHVQRPFLVKVGQKVARGQRIAKVGSTGAPGEPHLHWGVNVGGKEVDGWPLLDQNSTEEEMSLKILSFADGPHHCVIAPGATVDGWNDTTKVKSSIWPNGSMFPADVKVLIEQPKAPKGTFWHCSAGFYAGLYVPLTQVSDGGPVYAGSASEAADAVAAAAVKEAEKF
jgi:murein DD-endopeptidase MepM/ murein hydrolase activator NlpD